MAGATLAKILAGVLGLLLAAAPASAAPRIVSGTAGAFEYQAVLPAGYDLSDRRYPVLYLIAGNGSSAGWAPTALGLSGYAERDEAIVVSVVESQHNNLITDWADGSKPLDRDFAGALVPAVEQRLRTFGDRAHRAIAGVSAGGFSSMAIAARHPDLFVAAASFSGLVDIRDRGPAGQATVEVPQVLFVDMEPGELFRRFGNPYTNPLQWAERNPADLASNLGGLSLYAAAGSGIPSDPQEAAAAGATLGLQAVIENQLRSMAEQFVARLGEAGIPVTFRPHEGLHQSRHWIDDLARWWPQMTQAFGRRAPASFDYRSAAGSFSVWDWTFAADRARAPEFLQVTDASDEGVRLTGSGITRVTTAPLFRPHARVALTGARPESARADEDGRLSFTVDLGAPHAAEQYTPAAAIDTPMTRTVRFTPRGARSRARR